MPLRFEVVCRLRPGSTSVIVICAFGTTAPDESCTMPEIVPWSTWAIATAVTSSREKLNISRRQHRSGLVLVTILMHSNILRLPMNGFVYLPVGNLVEASGKVHRGSDPSMATPKLLPHTS